jgi:2-keto-4-pentenoate hydratase/2-oxohepta-3-ene-1,7-dioic acid hydratase in catechol pathway
MPWSVGCTTNMLESSFSAHTTVGGGCGIEQDRWLKPGDLIELEVEKIGVLSNRIVKPN